MLVASAPEIVDLDQLGIDLAHGDVTRTLRSERAVLKPQEVVALFGHALFYRPHLIHGRIISPTSRRAPVCQITVQSGISELTKPGPATLTPSVHHS